MAGNAHGQVEMPRKDTAEWNSEKHMYFNKMLTNNLIYFPI